MPIHDELHAIIVSVQNLSSTTRATRLERDNPIAWRKIWHFELLRVGYKECRVTYSKSTSKRLELAIKNGGLPRGEVPEFIKWVIENWRDVRRTIISTNPEIPRGPLAPDMNMVVFFFDRICAAFHREKIQSR
jgi:hypothetical protein